LFEKSLLNNFVVDFRNTLCSIQFYTMATIIIRSILAITVISLISNSRIYSDPNPRPRLATYARLGRAPEEIQRVFEAEPFRVKFDNWSSVAGIPRVTGKTKNGLGFILLTGPRADQIADGALAKPPTDLNGVSCMHAWRPSDSSTKAILLTLLNKTLPAWKNGGDWLDAALRRAEKSGEVRTKFRQAEIRLYLKCCLGSTPVVGLLISPEGELS
jgi:hypothetical protein